MIINHWNPIKTIINILLTIEIPLKPLLTIINHWNPINTNINHY